jgi:hypothetical protein
MRPLLPVNGIETAPYVLLICVWNSCPNLLEGPRHALLLACYKKAGSIDGAVAPALDGLGLMDLQPVVVVKEDPITIFLLNQEHLSDGASMRGIERSCGGA